jgi:hypothetical protein
MEKVTSDTAISNPIIPVNRAYVNIELSEKTGGFLHLQGRHISRTHMKTSRPSSSGAPQGHKLAAKTMTHRKTNPRLQGS